MEIFQNAKEFEAFVDATKNSRRNRTDTNSYTCTDLFRVYIFHKLRSQHSICMTCSDARKHDSSQFIYNFMFVLCITRVTHDHRCSYTGFLSSTLQDTALVRHRQCKMHTFFFFFFKCPSHPTSPNFLLKFHFFKLSNQQQATFPITPPVSYLPFTVRKAMGITSSPHSLQSSFSFQHQHLPAAQGTSTDLVTPSPACTADVPPNSTTFSKTVAVSV